MQRNLVQTSCLIKQIQLKLGKGTVAKCTFFFFFILSKTKVSGRQSLTPAMGGPQRAHMRLTWGTWEKAEATLLHQPSGQKLQKQIFVCLFGEEETFGWFAHQVLWVITTADSHLLKGFAPYAQVSLYFHSVHNKLWLYEGAATGNVPRSRRALSSLSR